MVLRLLMYPVLRSVTEGRENQYFVVTSSSAVLCNVSDDHTFYFQVITIIVSLFPNSLQVLPQTLTKSRKDFLWDLLSFCQK